MTNLWNYDSENLYPLMLSGKGFNYDNKTYSQRTNASCNASHYALNFHDNPYKCGVSNVTQIESNTTYTVSFYAHGMGIARQIDSCLLVDNATPTNNLFTFNIPSNSWYRCSFTVTVGDVTTEYNKKLYFCYSIVGGSFSITNIQIEKGVHTSQYEPSNIVMLSDNGFLWGASGGFGGVSAIPKIEIDANGLKCGNTTLYGNSAWSEPSSATVLFTDISTYWTKSVGVTTLSDTEMELNDVNSYTEITILTEANKIYSFVSNVTGGEISSNLRHKYNVTMTMGESVVLNKDFYKLSTSSESHISVDYYSSVVGNLKVKIVYLGTFDADYVLPDDSDDNA